MNKNILILSAIFLLFVASVNAQRFPTKGQTSWASSQEYGLEKWLLISHDNNGTLKKGLNVSFDEVNLSKNLIVLGNISGEIPDSFKRGNGTSLFNNLFVSAFDGNFSLKTTDNLTEGTNLYFTNARADARFNSLFASSFNSNLSAKSTTDLTEGTNLYFTNARADTRFNALFVGSFNSNLSVREDSYFKNTNESNPTNATIELGNIGGYSAIWTGVNQSAREGAYFKNANESNPTNDTLQLSSQERVTGLNITDSPKFSAINVTNVRILTGTASPEGSITATAGSVFLATNGSFYIKSSGTGNTGWVQNT